MQVIFKTVLICAIKQGVLNDMDNSTVINKNKNAVTVWTRMERKSGEDGNSSAVFSEKQEQ